MMVGDGEWRWVTVSDGEWRCWRGQRWSRDHSRIKAYDTSCHPVAKPSSVTITPMASSRQPCWKMKYIHSSCLQYNIISLQQTHNSHPTTKPNLAFHSYHIHATVTRLHSLASTDTDNKQSLQYIHLTYRQTDRHCSKYISHMQTNRYYSKDVIYTDRQTLW